MEDMIVICGYYGWLVDGKYSVYFEVLTHFLFLALDGKRETCIGALIEPIGVIVDVVLSYLAVAIHDVVDKDSNVDAVETFIVIFYFGIVYWFDGFVYLVDSNADDVLVSLIVVLVVLFVLSSRLSCSWDAEPAVIFG